MCPDFRRGLSPAQQAGRQAAASETSGIDLLRAVGLPVFRRRGTDAAHPAGGHRSARHRQGDAHHGGQREPDSLGGAAGRQRRGMAGAAEKTAGAAVKKNQK